MSKPMTIAQIQPLAGYVLVEPAAAQTKTASGIYLPETSDKKPQHGTVLACGGDTFVDGHEAKCPVKKGDSVIYKQWGGNELKLGDKEYQLLEFKDIIAVIAK